MKNPFAKKGLKKNDLKKIEEVKKITRIVEIENCGECKKFRMYPIQGRNVCQCAATMGTEYRVATVEYLEEMFNGCTVWPSTMRDGGPVEVGKEYVCKPDGRVRELHSK